MKKQHTENKNKPESSQKNQAPQKQVGRSLYYPESYKFNTMAQQNKKKIYVFLIR